MPKTGTETTAKRKRPATKDLPKKRPRPGQDNDVDNSRADILSLETAILESKKNYNNITALLVTARSLKENEDAAILAIVALCRVFIRLLAAGALLRKKSMPEKDVVVVHWLKDRLTEFHEILLSLFVLEGHAMTALALSMRLLKAEGQHPQSERDAYCFPKSFLKDIVGALCQSQVDPAVRTEFVSNFVDEFEDVRLYTFKAVHDIIGKESASPPKDLTFGVLFEFLSSIEGVPESSEELEDFYVDPPEKKKNKGYELFSVAKHKKQAQEAWLALMKLDMDKDQRKRLLDVMSRIVAPWFTKPELLMDFLTDCYNTGGSMSLLALSGIFYLIQERNLDYPAFYTKLYSLLDADILHSRYRSRFFRLLDTFLASSHLPAALVASFVKRLARLSLNAPPTAIVTIVPWMYNLFKKHPTCTFMMHREPRTDEEKRRLAIEGMEDPFLPDEEEPMETRAIDSCIWEIVQLQSHYHPNVATIAKIISQQFTKQFYQLEDFLDHSYGSLVEGEMTKNVKKAPVVEFHIPKRMFLPQDIGSGVEDGLLVKLWEFE